MCQTRVAPVGQQRAESLDSLTFYSRLSTKLPTKHLAVTPDFCLFQTQVTDRPLSVPGDVSLESTCDALGAGCRREQDGIFLTPTTLQTRHCWKSVDEHFVSESLLASMLKGPWPQDAPRYFQR